MTITVTRVDGALAIKPAPPYLINYLQYTHRSFETVNWQRVNKFEKKMLYSLQEDGSIITFQGFFERVYGLITKNGDTCVIEDFRTPLGEPDWQAIKDINWEAIGSKGPRDYQFDPIVDFIFKAKENSGIVNATGGWGKTVMQAITYAAFNKKNTILAIPIKQVFTQSFKIFTSLFPNKHIGRVGDGYREISSDITLSTYKSLPNCALEKCELLLADEIQGTTGEKTLDVFLKLHPIRSFGYTATDQNLFNNADKVIKGLFGERLIFIPYEEAQEDGAVVPITVYFVNTPTDIMINAGSLEAKINKGIQACEKRNKLIAQVCCKVPEEWQTLVFVDKIENHLIPLHKVMPAGTRYLHRKTSKTDLGAYSLSAKTQDKIIEQYKNNEFQYLIATDAFRAGVDIPNCRVVVQASGGTSEVELLQEAFRGSRTLKESDREILNVTPKTHCILIDFMDQHDEQLENMSIKRKEIYASQGWKIKVVDKVEDIDWYDYAPVQPKKSL